MRKSFAFLGVGALALAALFFYAEQKRDGSQGSESARAIEELLRAQNQALVERLEGAVAHADRDALGAALRWRKTTGMRSFVADTALAEPDEPKWMVVGGKRIRAAGVMNDALLEDALESHLAAPERLAMHSSKGKYYLFINGTVEGQPYAAAYAPEAFFSAFRSDDGIRAIVVLADGTVAFHPLARFVGSKVGNLRPVAAGIQELSAGSSSPFFRHYLGLEGKDAVGAWAPLPSLGVLLGSEWPRAFAGGGSFSAWIWLGLAMALLGAACLGFAARRPTPEPVTQPFDEGRLDPEAMAYLEEARATADRAVQWAALKDEEMAQAYGARDEALERLGLVEWRLGVVEEFLEKILPRITHKQVWTEFGEMMARRAPGLSAVVYRYSPASYSLVPESLHDSVGLSAEAAAYLKDSRIFLGSLSYLDNLLSTEGFQRWNARRERQMPGVRAEFRAYPVRMLTGRGLLLVYFDDRLNAAGELNGAIDLFTSLLQRAATFCDSLAQLLQSLNAKGSSRPTVAGSPNDLGNRPRPS